MTQHNHHRAAAAPSALALLALLAILSACSSESELRFTDGFIQDHDFSVELNSAGDGLDISFTPQSDASYQLTRTSESGCTSDTCADYLTFTMTDDSTYFDSLPTDTYYYYKLTVTLPGVNEEFFAQYPSFGVPYDFATTAGNGQLTLSWTPFSEDVTYNIYRSSDHNCELTNYSSCADGVLLTNKSSGYIDTGLSNYTTYYYWIEAIVDGITYRSTNSISGTPDASANILPDDFVAVAADTQVTLSWSPYSDVTTYSIYRSSDPDCDLDSYENACTEGALFTNVDTSFVDTGLTTFNTYYYWIEANLNGVTQRAIDAISGTLSANIIPSDLTVFAGDTQITLIWTPYSDATNYNIYRSSDPDCDLDNYNTACSSSESELFVEIDSEFVDIGLTNGITYYYWIEATLNGVTQRATDPISAIPHQPIVATGTINDTGIDWGGDYDSGNNSDCSSNVSAPQDCHQGRDATHNDDVDGQAGFSFTKLDSNGEALAASANDWSCVLDNVTGLIWEVKTDDGSERDKDNAYRWGGLTAIGRNSSDREGDYYDDWNNLVNTTNSEQLCGYSDWHVPSRHELRSIVDYSRISPSIDPDFFPNTRSSSYWSASPDADNSSNAWLIYFLSYAGDYDDDSHRDGNYYVRLVRSGQ